MKKRIIIIALCAAMICSGCESSTESTPEEPISNLSTSATTTEAETEELSEEDIAEKEAFASSTAENDTDTGLKTIKIDTAEMELSQEQKEVISYFDTDYLYISGDYEFIRRYPQVFDKTQVRFTCVVDRVVSQTQDEFEMIVDMTYSDDVEKRLAIVRGKTDNVYYMEGDSIEVYGQYLNVENYTIDEKSDNYPSISAHKITFSGEPRFSAVDMKRIAKHIFGNDIGVSADEYSGVVKGYTVTLENQSNAKFSQFQMYDNGGSILPYWEGIAYQGGGVDDHIGRSIEFSADFEHFILFTNNLSTNSMDIEYYDKDYKKIWEREFEEVDNLLPTILMDTMYDYTKNNIYIIINNELHIINTETGEDTFPPVYVGVRHHVYKLNDGVLVISENKADGIMKINLDGTMAWKTNIAGDIVYFPYGINVQAIGDNIVIYANMDEEDHYLVLEKETGAVVIDAVKR